MTQQYAIVNLSNHQHENIKVDDTVLTPGQHVIKAINASDGPDLIQILAEPEEKTKPFKDLKGNQLLPKLEINWS